MTHKEAIEELEVLYKRLSHPKDCEEGYYSFSDGSYAEAVKMAMSALEELCNGRYVLGDCDHCSRTYGTVECCSPNNWFFSCKKGMKEYAEQTDKKRNFQNFDTQDNNINIDSLPSVNRSKGKWEHKELIPNDITGHTYAECSICHKVRIIDNFCPNCGAKMESDEE